MELDVDTELMELARCGDLDKVQRLLQEHRAIVNKKNKIYNKTALYYACENGHTEVARYLLENGASVHLGEMPLTVSVRNKHMSVVQLLLAHGAHPDRLREGYTYTNRCTMPLHMAAAQGDRELVNSSYCWNTEPASMSKTLIETLRYIMLSNTTNQDQRHHHKLWLQTA